MRSALVFFGFIMVVVQMAAQQTLTVTPQSLAGWTLSGVEAATLAAKAELALPPGSQLARSFLSENLSIQFVTQPVVGRDYSDWPVLEIGSAALVFSRTEHTGKLVLVLGASTLLDVPFTFPLDDAGRSLAALTVGFAREGSVISVEAAGRIWQYSAGPDVGSSLEIAISAGGNQTWEFQDLAVIISPNPQLEDASAVSDTTDKSKSQPEAYNESENPSVFLPRLSLPEATLRTELASKTDYATQSADKPPSLEVFTPPSVRSSRVESVRTAVAKEQK